MSRSAHTKGPWRWSQDSHANWRLVTADRRQLLILGACAGPRGWGALTLVDRKNSPLNNMPLMASAFDLPDHPDARLMAASPQLAEAAELALAWLQAEHGRHPIPGSCESLQDKLQDALRLAGLLPEPQPEEV